jgi:hypothetical protein
MLNILEVHIMPVIRVSEETWERLKKWAIPLEDTPDDVMKRVLDFADNHKQYFNGDSETRSNNPEQFNHTRASDKRLPRGTKVSDEAYFMPILEALYELGGKGDIEEVLGIVENKMRHLFREVDYQPLNSGNDVRWRNTAQWARYKLVQRGLLRGDSLRGIWELTRSGTQEVEQNRA